VAAAPHASRDAEIVAAARLGQTHDALARQHGISRARITQIVTAAAPCEPAEAQRQLIADRLRSRWDEMEKIVRNKPIKTTSIGRTQWDPRTCTCDTRARTDRDHAPDCQVQPVLDEALVVSAVKERRMVGESLRRLTGADEAPRGIILDDRALRVMTEVAAARNQLEQQSPGIPRPSLPADYHALSPEQQLRAVLDRERAHRDAMLAAIPAPPPGDDDVVDAEIVEE
jgi:hypothetical protein